MRRVTPLLVLLLTLLDGCARPEFQTRAFGAREGFANVTGGRVWYRIVGSGTGTPLLLIHGGPGAPSDYLEPLERLAADRPVVFYDQLGCGRSDRPTSTALWTTGRFADELDDVRRVLGLDEVHILGHSWGTMLVTEYLATHRPAGIRSLVLASPSVSVPRRIDDAERLRAGLPLDLQETLRREEERGSTDSEAYRNAIMAFNHLHLCRLDPWPEALEQTLDGFGREVYETMWGPSQIRVTGTLKQFDRTGELGAISVPTLITAGRYDTTTPSTAAWYQSLVPGSRLEIFRDSAHLAMLEEPDRYVEVLRAFLLEADRRSNQGEGLGAARPGATDLPAMRLGALLEKHESQGEMTP